MGPTDKASIDDYSPASLWLSRPTPVLVERDVTSTFGGDVDLHQSSCFVKTNGTLFCRTPMAERASPPHNEYFFDDFINAISIFRNCDD